MSFPAEAGTSGSSGSDSASQSGTPDRSVVERERALQRITALGEMTGGIAHDFRNVLAVVQAGLRLAEANLDDPQKLRACLAGAREGTERGLELTSQLLAFAKNQELAPQHVDVSELVGKVEILLRYSAGPGSNLKLDLASDLPTCMIDRPQCNAALLNLVVNARDAMPDGGQIFVSTMLAEEGEPSIEGRTGPHVCIRVQDSGQGMPPSVVDRIFDPLFTTKGQKGTGLGLAQVYAFVTAMNGRIAVRSQPGEGTTVDLLFPVSTTPSRPQT